MQSFLSLSLHIQLRNHRHHLISASGRGSFGTIKTILNNWLLGWFSIFVGNTPISITSRFSEKLIVQFVLFVIKAHIASVYMCLLLEMSARLNAQRLLCSVDGMFLRNEIEMD